MLGNSSLGRSQRGVQGVQLNPPSNIHDYCICPITDVEKIFSNTCSFNTYLDLASYSFVCYNSKKNPHMLNAVPLSLRINGRGFRWVWLATFLQTEPPLEKYWLRPWRRVGA